MKVDGELFAPAAEFDTGTGVCLSRVPIADMRGEELDGALLSLRTRGGDDAGQTVPGGHRP